MLIGACADGREPALEADGPARAAASAFTSDEAECSAFAEKPALWLPLDTIDDAQLTREVVGGEEARVTTGDGASLADGPVGTHIQFDGSTYIEIRSGGPTDETTTDFSVGAWVSPSEASTGTIIARGAYKAPGSWRLFAVEGGALAFEMCRQTQCYVQKLDGGLAAGGWSYIFASTRVVGEGEDKSVEVTLTSQTPDGAVVSSASAIAVDSKFSFNVPGSLSVGASLVRVPSEGEPLGPQTDVSPAEAFSGGIDEVMLFVGAASDSLFTELASATPSGLCEDCIHDVTPPTITCPPSVAIRSKDLTIPGEATATDTCDPNPSIVATMSSSAPGKDGSVVTVTYTATDSSGNQASCTSDVIIAAAEPPNPANKTGISGQSCTVSVPATIQSGHLLPIAIPNLEFQCSNGTCDIEAGLYITVPGATQSGAESFVQPYYWSNLPGRSGSAPSTNTQAISFELLSAAGATVTFRVVAREHGTGEALASWSCSDTVAIQPVRTEYCQQPISYWNNLVQSGQVTYLVMNPLNWNDSSGWFQGTSGPDLIIGNHHNNKISGNGGDDCIVGLGSNDKIHGNSGNDRIDGGDGNDEIWGDGDSDTLWGGAGADTMNGNEDPDFIYGGSSADTIHGNAGSDHVWGEAGNDHIWGDAGADTVDGGEGNDDIYGGDDGDSLLGRSGCDTIQGDDGDDWIFGDGGQDRIWGGWKNDHIVGGAERDFLRGDDGDDYIEGKEAIDWMCGNTGNDTIWGYDPNTTGSGVVDECRGGTGNDSVHCSSTSGRACTGDWEALWLDPCL